MPQLNFQKQFAGMVEDKTKRTTIRARRKRPFKTGDKLYFYTGMRTKNCRKLGEAFAVAVFDLEIKKAGVNCYVFVNNKPLGPIQEQRLARRDGFKNAAEFRNFFKLNHGFPFVGQLIVW